MFLFAVGLHGVGLMWLLWRNAVGRATLLFVCVSGAWVCGCFRFFVWLIVDLWWLLFVAG